VSGGERGRRLVEQGVTPVVPCAGESHPNERDVIFVFPHDADLVVDADFLPCDREQPF
jgi:hypothetical protein